MPEVVGNSFFGFPWGAPGAVPHAISLDETRDVAIGAGTPAVGDLPVPGNEINSRIRGLQPGVSQAGESHPTASAHMARVRRASTESSDTTGL